ncbi:MAG TPA: tetratricopeptide repeat protein, partial [Thermoanaerobaculia bacterium]|nr:tetratricopeptide repeat protein [Thermoanaerobaculia bacterium]
DPPQPARLQSLRRAAAIIVVVFLAGAAAILVHRESANSRAAAHEAYLKGREALSAPDHDAAGRARVYLDRAIALDPGYAPARAALAVALNHAGVAGSSDPVVSHRQALLAANEALRLDPSLAEAYVARATARLRLEWDWAGAEEDLRKAIALDPDYVKPHETLAQLLVAEGRWREALRELATARQLDPLSLSLRRDEGVTLYYGRQYEAAIRQLSAVVEIDPADAIALRFLSDAHLQAGHIAAARDLFVRWLDLVGVDEAEVERARVILQEHGFAGIYERVTSGSASKGHYYKRAAAHAALGRNRAAVAALEEAFRGREAQLVHLKTDPQFDPLRSDRRFESFLARARFR